jgi:predicted lipase
MNAKVVVFRGTDSSSWYNWAENMRAWRTDTTYPVPGAPKSVRVHSGFLVLYNSSSMASTFKKAFAEMMQQHPDGSTIVLGHSMGGALAQLAALDLKIEHDLKDVKVFTFGAPRLGNSVFSDFFNEHVTEAWRFTHGRDIVPSVPPQLFGFHHVSREVWLVDVEDAGSGDVQQRIVVCDDTGEDPTCHNSACRLGLCTSVADHLQYYGGHMYRGGEC